MNRLCAIAAALLLLIPSSGRRLHAEPPKAGDVMQVSIRGIETTFHWCPKGKFTMGSPENEPGREIDEAQREVIVSEGFWLAETETTQRLWNAVMGVNPSDFRGSENLPVNNVSWNDCQRFIATIQNDAPPGLAFKLPTEEHWEYACRAGSQSAYWWGESLNDGKGKLNGYDQTCAERDKFDWEAFPFRDDSVAPCAVGRFDANPWGFNDMSGNLSEWCADVYRAKTDDSEEERVHRGGGWYDAPTLCRSAARKGFNVNGQGDFLGFRLELSASELAPATDFRTVEPNTPDQQLQPGDVAIVRISGVDTRFHWSPPGSFMMGSPEDEVNRSNSETLHKVELTSGFWMAETETTQQLWQAVTGETTNANSDDNYPVAAVSWDDCHLFIERIQEYAPKGMRFRLPSEAHWEYACRAGTTTAFWWGDNPDDGKGKLNGYDLSAHNEEGEDHVLAFDDGFANVAPVGCFEANKWGLKDMSGNVFEWVEDRMKPFTEENAVDPLCNDLDADPVIRGGSWRHTLWICRSAFRQGTVQTARHDDLGFRIELVKDK